MSGFGFTEAQNMFRTSVRNFAQKELAPLTKDLSKMDHIPRHLIKKLASQGYLGINLPEKYGGQTADWVSLGIAIEELSKVDLVLGMHLVFPTSVVMAMMAQGSEDLRQEWIPGLIHGDIMFCHALTEPDCGSDVAAIKTRATKKGDYYVLNGEKTSITLGIQADIALVFAKTDARAGAHGVSCFTVPLNSPGISRSMFEDMGMRHGGRASITFEDVKVPEKYRVGPEGQGFYITMGQFDVIRVGLGLGCLGAAQISLDDAMRYAKQRGAFGRPIAKFQGVSFKIAEHATLIEAARLLCYRTMWLKDQGLPHTKESAMCKWWCPQVSVNAIHDALLIHGHIGYSSEYPLQQRLRDTTGIEIADGTAQIMKSIICRELLGKEFLPY